MPAPDPFWRTVHLKESMTTCPFCNSEIDDGLSRFGGNCPHCFNVIPGEEAPTDPGVLPQPTGSVAPESSSGGKTLLVFGFLAFVAIGAAIGLGGKDSGAAVEPVSENALEKQAKNAEETRLKAMEAEIEATAAEAAVQAAAEKAKEEQALSQARAASAAQATKAVVQVVADASSNPATVPETQAANVVVPISTGPTREVLSGVLETPAEINRAVRKSLKRYKGQLEQCYNIELNEDETLKGRWQVSFTVESSGKTSGVSVKHITRSHPALEACMAKNVKRWSFPRIAEAYPYVKEYSFGR